MSSNSFCRGKGVLEGFVTIKIKQVYI